jgi:hypothetical protein
MIFTGFVYLASYILAVIVNVLPYSSGFPPEVTSAFNTMAGYVQILDTLLPIDTLAAVLAVIIATDLVIFGFKSAKWLISHIPFVGGRG